MKKTFHYDELIKDIKKLIRPIFQDQMLRIFICSMIYCIIGIIATAITNDMNAIPIWGLLLIPLIDLLISTFFKYYY